MIIKKTHIGSYGVILNKDKILLIKKAYGAYKGLLDLPGGRIEHEETPEETLKREIMEETGTSVIDYKLLDIKSYNIKWQMDDGVIEDLHHLGILYKTNIKEEKIKDIPDGLDSLGASWYSLKELKKENITPFAYFSLEMLELINK